MAIPTPLSSETVVEIDERGRAHLFVDGVPVVGVLSINTEYNRNEEGLVNITMSARCVQYRMVKSSKKIVPVAGSI